MAITASKPDNIFSNIPKKDYLHLFDKSENNKPEYQKVIKFLEFQKQDVAKATDIALSSVRYEENKIPSELSDRIAEWANLLNMVAEFFEGDAKKTALWFAQPNPLLGYVPPRDMIRFGRYRKLLRFVFNTLDENKR